MKSQVCSIFQIVFPLWLSFFRNIDPVDEWIVSEPPSNVDPIYRAIHLREQQDNKKIPWVIRSSSYVKHNVQNCSRAKWVSAGRSSRAGIVYSAGHKVLIRLHFITQRCQLSTFTNTKSFRHNSSKKKKLNRLKSHNCYWLWRKPSCVWPDMINLILSIFFFICIFSFVWPLWFFKIFRVVRVLFFVKAVVLVTVCIAYTGIDLYLILFQPLLYTPPFPARSPAKCSKILCAHSDPFVDQSMSRLRPTTGAKKWRDAEMLEKKKSYRTKRMTPFYQAGYVFMYEIKKYANIFKLWLWRICENSLFSADKISSWMLSPLEGVIDF